MGLCSGGLAPQIRHPIGRGPGGPTPKVQTPRRGSPQLTMLHGTKKKISGSGWGHRTNPIVPNVGSAIVTEEGGISSAPIAHRDSPVTPKQRAELHK